MHPGTNLRGQFEFVASECCDGIPVILKKKKKKEKVQGAYKIIKDD